MTSICKWTLKATGAVNNNLEMGILIIVSPTAAASVTP